MIDIVEQLRAQSSGNRGDYRDVAAAAIEALRATVDRLVQDLDVARDDTSTWRDRAQLAEARLTQRTYIYEGDGRIRLQQCENCSLPKEAE